MRRLLHFFCASAIFLGASGCASDRDRTPSNRFYTRPNREDYGDPARRLERSENPASRRETLWRRWFTHDDTFGT